MSDPAPCPACSEQVDATEALELDRCPSCSTPLRDLFRLAMDQQSRT